MYPLLRLDSERAAWIEQVSNDMAALAEDARAELQAANRANRFPRDVFAEMGRRGYCGPMVPTEWGGLGGGVREYVVINEETARHGMVTPQVSVQGQRWLLDWGTDEQKERWLKPLLEGQIRSYKVRMVPTAEQARELKRCFSAARSALKCSSTPLRAASAVRRDASFIAVFLCSSRSFWRWMASACSFWR